MRDKLSPFNPLSPINRPTSIGVAIVEAPGEARTEGHLGRLHQLKGQRGEARRRFERSLELAREAGALNEEIRAIGNLGTLCRASGDLVAAHDLAVKHLALSRETVSWSITFTVVSVRARAVALRRLPRASKEISPKNWRGRRILSSLPCANSRPISPVSMTVR